MDPTGSIESQTFVTGLLSEGEQQPVRVTRAKLNDCIDKIDEYYDIVNQKHDRDFVNAYKVTTILY